MSDWRLNNGCLNDNCIMVDRPKEALCTRASCTCFIKAGIKPFSVRLFLTNRIRALVAEIKRLNHREEQMELDALHNREEFLLQHAKEDHDRGRNSFFAEDERQWHLLPDATMIRRRNRADLAFVYFERAAEAVGLEVVIREKQQKGG